MKNAYLAEDKGLKAAGVPADLNTAGLTGARISLAKSQRMAVVVHMGGSTAATASFTLRQHDAASGGNSKDLEVSNPYYVKASADTKFTKVDPASAAATYDLSATFAGDSGVVVFEVLESQLDVSGGFDHFSINIADPAAAKIFSAVYVAEMSTLPAYEQDL